MKKRRLRYYITHTQDNDPRKGQRWCYYRDMVETTPDKCDICAAVDYLGELNLPPQIMNLAKANIARHKASGKHWRKVGSGRYRVR